LLPHIFEQTTRYQAAAGWLLAGILAFFVLEKLVLWRHSHDHAGAAEAAISAAQGQTHSGHGHAADETGRTTSAWMIIIGDGFHNFTDGLAIAAAFMADFRIGVVTSIAIIAHELPQELGDFLVLIHSGFSRRRALFWNVMSSFATLFGALLAYAMLVSLAEYSIMFLCFAASSMIYVAIADLIPGLHKRSTLIDSVQQISLIAAGVGSIWVVHLFA
jgi:zinc and cadmium transporter